MWGHEPAIGATVYLNQAKQYHAATVASFTFQSEKEGSDTQVGTALNLEGGIGADFLKGGLTAGLAYYASFKLEEDRIDGIPSIFIRGKNKVFAFGPEITLGARSKRCPVRFLEGELPVGGLRAHQRAGRRVPAHPLAPGQANQAAGLIERRWRECRFCMAGPDGGAYRRRLEASS
jgi:hypothetical protein